MSTRSLFKEKIKKLNFSEFDTVTGAGILFTENYEKNSDVINKYPGVLFALETAAKKYKADAVYFRSLRDRILPQVYIFDCTAILLSNEDKNNLHKKMWNGFQSPVYIIIEKTSVGIFDSREKPKSGQDNYVKEILSLTSEALSKFNAKDFDNGLFWESQSQKHFKFEESAAKDLIRGLKAIYRDFQKKSNLDRHIALKLLIQSLLIKYLEERDDTEENGYFAKNYFERYFHCKNFCDVISSNQLLALFDKLSEDFNGKIFLWDKKKDKAAREAIQKTEATCLANYLEGDNHDGQYVLWRLYSFSHLPVEIISSVYEELLTDSKDVVYTPEMVVDVMIDECMPLEKPVENFKLIDVSCGSGIFLVKAYKRIIQWWRYEQWKKNGCLVKPSLDTLKDLLTTNIYGLDIQQDAVNLAVFSLALAMLDEVDLTPRLWEKLKFPDFSDNIFKKNFFLFISGDHEKDFDLVIGNPPFNLPPNEDGKEPARKKYFAELKNRFGYKSVFDIPDENPALHFLVQSINLLKPNSILCLIQPAGPILYQNLEFRKKIFNQYNLLQVIDFTKLSNVLWQGKKVSAAALFLQNCLPDENDAVHIVANRLPQNTNRLFLEFDYYDFYPMDKESVKNNFYIWKANLVGGGQRLLSLIDRLAKLPTLKEYLDKKVRENNWKYAEGYTVGNGGNYKRAYAKYLHNKKCIKPDNLTDKGVVKTDIETESLFCRPREESKEIFLSPHIVIKESLVNDRMAMDFLNYDAVFSNQIVGIHAPKNEKDKLALIYNILSKNNDLYKFYILTVSSRILVGRVSAFKKGDIDKLPFSENESRLKLSSVDTILINDVLNFQLNKENKSESSVDVEHLKAFSEVFCKTLNTIYQTDDKSFQLFKIIDAGPYFLIHIIYVKENTLITTETVDDLEQYIKKIIPIHKSMHDNYHVQRIIKLYAKDAIVIVKPKQMRYWLLSIALRDADESYADYVKARYFNVER